MKSLKLFVLLIIVALTHTSCEDDFASDYTTPEAVQTPVDGLAEASVDLLWDRIAHDESISQTGQSALRDDRDQPTGDALQLVYDQLIEEDAAEDFLSDMVAQYGLPAWGRSTIIRSHDSESYYISVPWIRSGAFTGVLQYLYIDDRHFAGFIPRSSINVEVVDDADPEALPMAFMAVMDLIYFGYRIDDVFEEDYFEWLKLYSVETGIESRSPTCSGYVNYSCSPCEYAFADECCYVTSWNLVCFSASGGPWNGGVSGGITTSGGGSSSNDGGGSSSGDGTGVTETIDPNAFEKAIVRYQLIDQIKAETGLDLTVDEIETLLEPCISITVNDGADRGQNPYIGSYDPDCVEMLLLDRLITTLGYTPFTNADEIAHLTNNRADVIHLTNKLGLFPSLPEIAAGAQFVFIKLFSIVNAEFWNLPASLLRELPSKFETYGLSDRLQIDIQSWLRMYNREYEDNGEDLYDAILLSITRGWNRLQATARDLEDHLSQLTDQFPSTTEEWQSLMTVFGPMLVDMGVDIGLDFIPIVGELNGLTNAYLEFQEGNYWLSGLEFIGAVAGIVPIGDLVNAGTEVGVASIKVFAAFKVIKVLAEVSGTVFRQIIDFGQAGLKVIWDDGLKKLFLRTNTNILTELTEAMIKVGEKLIFHDVRLNPTFLAKVSDLPTNLQDEVQDLYVNLKHPAGFKNKVNYDANINGTTVHFDQEGFPDFTSHSPGVQFKFDQNNYPDGFDRLIGNGTDFTKANNWAVANDLPGFVKLPNGQCEINGVRHTWHHHQDGRTMFPVPSAIHNVTSHSGGKAVLARNLEDIFNPPVF